MLTAAGVAPAAATQITVEDVKAADDDQVPISLDTKGEIKENVPADWYDKIVHTRDVTDKIQRNHSHRRSVIGIGYSAGERGGDNPHVVVGINQNSNAKEKDKKEIPDEREGVRVEKQEHEIPTADNCPNTDEYSNLCDNYDCDPFPKGDPIPAGPIIDFPFGGWLSHTSQTLWYENGSLKIGWLTSAHGVPGCENNGQSVHHQPTEDGGPGYKIGEVAGFHPDYDVAAIIATGGYNWDTYPSTYVHESSNLQGGYTYGPIEATMSKDGVDQWEAQGRKVFRYGGGTCYDYGEISANYSDATISGLSCSERINEVIRIEGDDADDGDSGGLHWGYYEPQDSYLGIGVHSASADGFLTKVSIASAGYRIDNDLGYFWSE